MSPEEHSLSAIPAQPDAWVGPLEDDEIEAILAIQEGLRTAMLGEGKSVDQVFAEMREQFPSLLAGMRAETTASE